MGRKDFKGVTLDVFFSDQIQLNIFLFSPEGSKTIYSVTK